MVTRSAPLPSCLTHVHLVLDPCQSGHSASKVLNNLKGVASRRVFQTCPELKADLRSEHLWTNEYQAKLLPYQSAAAACRYVEQNPIEAGLPVQRYSWVDPLVRPSGRLTH